MKKKIISMLLVVSMVLSMVPAQVFATDTQQVSITENPFSDVTQSDWYYDYVLYVLENGLFDGVSNTKFDPSGTMTRAMYVTVMGRIAEMQVETYKQSGFTDVPNDNWASPYVAWAKDKEITSGVGNGKFAPNDFVTREQMAVFTVRFFEAYGIPFPDVITNTVPKDLDSVSDYAKDAVLKLWACGLFQGDASGNFNPQKNTTRAEAATFLGRVDKVVEGDTKEEPTTPSVGGTGQTYYTYKFVSNGGVTVSDRSIVAGESLNTLPIPYKENAIFVAWCYDEALTDMVETTDVATESAILYAKYEDTSALFEAEQVPVAVSIDSKPEFSITVTSKENITVEQFKERIEAKNLSSQLNNEWFKITKSGNQFTITGYNYPGGTGAQQPGFVEGSAYKITLLDDSLSYDGQDPSTRVYDFTIAREDVMNVSLDKTIKEIPMGDVSNLTANGKPTDTVYMPTIVVGADGTKTANGDIVGTFTYEKGNLAVGDTVAIYEGDTPPSLNRDTVVTPGNTGFVIITAKKGAEYTYRIAETEDILFTPDVLPVSVNADQDGHADDDSMTVSKAAMDYTDDRYAVAGLDSLTTVDVGDFVAFYTGEFHTNGTGAALQSYAEILTVTEEGDNYVITYVAADISVIQAAMAASKTENIKGEELLDGQDVEALENSIEQQAKDSGFVEDASMLLASLALETDSFTKLDEEYGLKTVEMQMNGEKITPETLQLMAGGAGGGAGGGSTVSMELSHLDANIDTEMAHFANRDGLAVTLELGITITIEAGENNIEIDVVGSFTQELSLDVSVDGDAVWKTVCGFIPYIAEYQVNASVELYTFTRISVDASITSHGAGPGPGEIEIEDISAQIEGLLDKVDREDAKTDARTLEEKYAAMLETESDWVTLFEQDLMKMSFNVLYVVDIRVSAAFVVSANMNLALGASFEYTNAKKYIYSISVFEGKIENDVIDLVPEHYEFEFYVMGTLGLRAGVNIEIAVGVISCDLGSIGFGAEVGAYVKVWGYFHYKLEVTKPLGKPEQKITNYSGALLFELGVYLEITFKIQILCDSLSYNPTLYENEWPLWQAGYQDNVRDFSYEQEDVPEITLKSYITKTQIPDDLFEMEYLDLKEGLDDNGECFTSIYSDEKNFIITSTNPAFSYDASSNTITITPPKGSVEEDGELLIIWKDRPLAFSSAPIERRIPMSWNNLLDGYAIVPYTNGGSYIPVMIKAYGEDITAPQNPTRAGYTFGGWYEDATFTKSYTFPATMPAESAEIYAKWNVATDTPYTVNYYGKVLGKNEYTLLGSDAFTGTTNAKVTPEAKAFKGYTAPKGKEATILADGSLTVNYYYDLQKHKVTFAPGEVEGSSAVQILAYGATITAPRFAKDDYTFIDWDKAVATHMGTKDLTYTATWEKAPPSYRVEHYVMQANGQYAFQELSFEKATTAGEQIAANSLKKDDYVEAGVISFEKVMVDGVAVTGKIAIAEDGSTVIKVYYDRKQYTVTYALDNDKEDIVQTLYVGEKIVPPTPTKAGFVFAGFGTVAETMGTENLTYTASWTEAGDVQYTVKHIRQDLDGNYPTAGDLVEMEVKHDGTTGKDTTATAKTYEGFATPETVTQETVLANGKTVVEIRYTRNSYTVNWNVDGAITTDTVLYGAEISKPTTDPTKATHHFDKWVDSTTKTELTAGTLMGTTDRTFEAVWREFTDGEKEYTLSYAFKLEDGSTPEGVTVPESITVTFDDTYSPFPEIPVGYELVKRELSDGTTAEEGDYVRIASNHTLITVLKPAKYWVYCYESEERGPTTSFAPKEKIYADYGSYFTLPIYDATERPAYTHTGWILYGSDPEVQLSIENPQDLIQRVPAKFTEYVATWTPNIYHIYFDTTGGTEIEPIPRIYSEYTYTDEFEEPTREGYTFDGWLLNGEKAPPFISWEYDVTMVAQWKPITYSIRYDDDDGGDSVYVYQNPRTYTADSDNIVLNDITKPESSTGHKFDGWYYDEARTEKVEGVAIETGSIGDITFYAKWVPQTFNAIFDDNTGRGTPQATQEFTTMDFSGNRGPTLMANPFTYPGYKFVGWATEPDGTGTVYDDRYIAAEEYNREDLSYTQVRDLMTQTLYAQWEPIGKNIYYRNVYTGATYHINPDTFTVEDEIILQDPEGIKEGYTFLGWYKKDGDSEVKVESIPGTASGVILTAKWSHPGEYRLQLTSWSDYTEGKATFMIVRSLPDGVEPSADPQDVYYRTVNGTAIGGVLADSAHFTHLDEYVTFTSEDGDDSRKFFEVEDISATTQYIHNDGVRRIASIYTEKDVKRYFEVELYKVTNTTNAAKNGTIDEENSRAKVYLTQPSVNTIATNFYDEHFWLPESLGSVTVTKSTDQKLMHTMPVSEYKVSQHFETSTGDHLRYVYYEDMLPYFTTSTNANDLNLGVQLWGHSTNDTFKTLYYYYTDGSNTPIYNGEGKLPKGSGSDKERYDVPTNVSLPMNAQEITIKYDGSGDGSAVVAPDFYLSVKDSREPEQEGIAPMAAGSKYKAGDAISIAVVYNEVVAKTSDMNLDVDALKNNIGLDLSDVQYVDGEGTNVLVFTATVKEDYTVDNIALMAEKPVLGTVKDLAD